MKAKERSSLLARVRAYEGGHVRALCGADMRFIEREIDRAVHKARRELTARGTECPVCGWKPKRGGK